MIIIDRTEDIDVTPPNWRDVYYYEDQAICVHEWVAAQTRPMRSRADVVPGTMHMGELQAVTVSVTEPHVIFRMVVPVGVPAEAVEAFRVRASEGLSAAFGAHRKAAA